MHACVRVHAFYAGELELCARTCCNLAHRLRTASSERPGSSAAIIRHRPPSRVTPLRMASSSHAAHSLRWPSLLLPLASPAPVSSGWEANAAPTPLL